MAEITIDKIREGFHMLKDGMGKAGFDAPPNFVNTMNKINNGLLSLSDSIAALIDVLSEYDVAVSCEECGNQQPQTDICLFCGYNISDADKEPVEVDQPTASEEIVDKVIDEAIVSTFSEEIADPFRSGSKASTIFCCVRDGAGTVEIIEALGTSDDKAAINKAKSQIHNYISSWRKKFGWDIEMVDNGYVLKEKVKLEDHEA